MSDGPGENTDITLHVSPSVCASCSSSLIYTFIGVTAVGVQAYRAHTFPAPDFSLLSSPSVGRQYRENNADDVLLRSDGRCAAISRFLLLPNDEAEPGKPACPILPA